MADNLTELNSVLFEQLRKLNESKGSKLDDEVKRARSVASISSNIVSVHKTMLDAIRLKTSLHGLDDGMVVSLIGDSEFHEPKAIGRKKDDQKYPVGYVDIGAETKKMVPKYRDEYKELVDMVYGIVEESGKTMTIRELATALQKETGETMGYCQNASKAMLSILLFDGMISACRFGHETVWYGTKEVCEAELQERREILDK